MPLDHQQLEEIRQILDTRYTALRSEVIDDESKIRAQLTGDTVGGHDDRSAAIQVADVEDAELARDLHELEHIENARKRLDSPDFGSCINCNQPIPYERLRVLPATIRCLSCQRQHERVDVGRGS
ncbi:MAG: TraR/DksA family transcriptional regulator [Betaproteobacteria bacterium]